MNDDKEKKALQELREKKLPGITAGEAQEWYRQLKELEEERKKREQEKTAEKVK